MKRVLVTGGTGFVGANLVRRLLREGHEVQALVRPQHAVWRLADVQADIRFVTGDIADGESVRGAVLQARPDWIFHLAAHGQYSWETDVDAMLRTNVLGTAALVRAAVDAGCEAFVNTGSSSEYGLKGHPPAEDEALDPNSCYAVTKGAATAFCRCTARERDVHIPTLRLYSVYGPYEHPDRLIPTLVKRGLNGELPPLVDPNVARDFVYVDDVVDAYLLAATLPGQEHGAIYNVGSGVQTTMREMVELTRRLLDIRVEPLWGSMANRAWDTTCWVADNRKIVRELGWQPRTDLETGLRRTIERARPG